MIKLANIFYFIAELLKPVSEILAKAQPAFKKMGEANKVDKFIGDLEK